MSCLLAIWEVLFCLWASVFDYDVFAEAYCVCRPEGNPRWHFPGTGFFVCVAVSYLNPDKWARLASQGAPGTCLSLQCWYYKGTPTHFFSNIGSGDWTCISMLARQALYWPSHLPSPGFFLWVCLFLFLIQISWSTMYILCFDLFWAFGKIPTFKGCCFFLYFISLVGFGTPVSVKLNLLLH